MMAGTWVRVLRLDHPHAANRWVGYEGIVRDPSTIAGAVRVDLKVGREWLAVDFPPELLVPC